MRRNFYVRALSAMPFALGPSAEAHQAKVARVGFLNASTASGSAGLLEAFWLEMRKLGWIEGKNITMEYRFAEQKSDRGRQPDLAADLVRLKVDLIIVAGGPEALAVKGATSNVPNVHHHDGDPRGFRFGCHWRLGVCPSNRNFL